MSGSNFIVRGGADFSNLTKALTKTQTQFTGFQSSISKSMNLVKNALATIAVGKLIKDSTQAAMSVQSSIDNIGRTMGGSAEIFNNWAQTQAKAFGMARSEAFKYGATYSNLISGFTKDTAETEKYTEQLLKASAIIASKTGRTVEDVSERIRSGLLGNTEAIEDVGIYAQVAMLKSTDAFKKMANGRTWDQLSYYEQQQIRIMSVLEQATKKYGDTLADTTATRQQFFIATLKNIQLNLGNIVLPIYNAVLPALNSLASKVESVTNTFAQFMGLLFGQDITTYTKGTNTQTESMNDLAGATEAAGKAAKKSAMSFDELNIVNSSSGSGSSGSGGTGNSGSSSGASSEESKTKGFSRAIEDMLTAIQPTTKALKELWDNGLSKLGNFVWTALGDFYKDFLVPVGKWTLGVGFPEFCRITNDILSKIDFKALNEALDKLWKALSPFAINVGEGLLWFYENVLNPLLETTVNEVVVDFLEALGSAIEAVNKAADKFKNNKGLTSITDFLIEIQKSKLTNIGDLFENIGDAFGNLGDFIDKPNWSSALDYIKEIASISLDFTGFSFLSDFIDNFPNDWKNFKNSLKGISVAFDIVFGTSLEEVKKKFSELSGAFFGKTVKFAVDIATTAEEIRTKYAKLAGEFVGKTVKFLVSITQTSEEIKNKYTSLASKFVGKTVKFAVNIATTAQDIYKSGVELIKNFINGFKSLSLPKIKLDVSYDTSGLLGKLGQALGFSGFPKLNLSFYKDGGFPSTGEMFIANESGPELVGRIGGSSAVVNQDQIVESVSIGVANAVGAVLGSQRGNTGDVILQVGEEELARAVLRGMQSLGRRINQPFEFV